MLYSINININKIKLDSKIINFISEFKKIFNKFELKNNISKIENFNIELFNILKNNTDRIIIVNQNYEIISGFMNVIAYMLEEKSNFDVLINYDYNYYDSGNEYVYSDDNIHYHYDSDGNPDESNDVWEYGDVYHIENK